MDPSHQRFALKENHCVRHLLTRFCKDQSGSALIEYGLIASGAFAFSYFFLKGSVTRRLESLHSENQKLKHLLAKSMLENLP